MISEIHNTFKRKYGFVVLAISVLAISNIALAKGEVTEALISSAPAIPVSYMQDGTLYRWGAGQNIILDGFTYQNQEFIYDTSVVDRVEIQRVDNKNASGVRCSLFAETVNFEFLYAPSYPGNTAEGFCDVSKLISDNIVNVNPLDVFANTSSRPETSNNIERVDFITNNGISTGLSPAQLTVSGVTVVEKAGNNGVKVAAITSLGSNGLPDAYGSLVRVDRSFDNASDGLIRYGVTEIDLPFHYLTNSNGETPGNVVFRSSAREAMGIAFISQQDLGLATGQTYYGFSVFATDVDDAIHQLTDPASFPLDTHPENLGPGDADFSAASAFLAGNSAPIANDDSATTLLGQPVPIDILANDNDPDGDTLIITIVTPPQNGSVTIVNNQLVFTPDAGFTGSDSITYQIDDGNGGRDTATVVISVGPGNALPVANDDIAATGAAAPVSIAVLDNDSDPDGDALSITPLSQPANGSVVLSGDSFTYTPEAGFSGTDSFQYQISDGQGGTDTATVIVSVTAVLSGASGRIETGLDGHGAGSFDIMWLILLGVFGLFRVRLRDDRLILG
ncbi:MAG TPA: hypothetical protein DD827_07450 [Gammaproteobacteria bacterium]|nr:hypothetical protein [Gammaproteobacteria bacterium]